MGYFNSERISEIELNLSRVINYDEYILLNRLLSIEQYRDECKSTFYRIYKESRFLNRRGYKNKVSDKTQKQLNLLVAPSVTGGILIRKYSDDILDPGIFYVGQDI